MQKLIPLAEPEDIAGLRVVPARRQRLIKGECFEALFSDEFTKFADDEIGSNLLVMHCVNIVPKILERHTDVEIFAFTQGKASMVFENDEEKPVAIHLKKGDIAIIAPGVWHYVGPAITMQTCCVVVVSKRTQTETKQINEIV